MVLNRRAGCALRREKVGSEVTLVMSAPSEKNVSYRQFTHSVAHLPKKFTFSHLPIPSVNDLPNLPGTSSYPLLK